MIFDSTLSHIFDVTRLPVLVEKAGQTFLSVVCFT